MQEKEKLQKPEVEVIKFEENSDVITLSSFTATGENGQGFQPGPPIP